ncbi:MAG: hypothetical protein JXR37_29480 [Kiritimatiellae bacterium]|nr:hypothetical protein [Kiritimatiellia bacterium]
MEIVEYGGWRNNVRLANREVELIVTRDVGPRVIRFGFIGARNVLGELDGQMGGTGEAEWMIRGGHRLWVAPEAKPWSYELDNVPVDIREAGAGIEARQPAGPVTGVAKTVRVALAPDANTVTVSHTLTNEGDNPVELAVWALTVMAKRGMAVIPLPAKIPHTERLTHNQEWSLWGYTDFSDPRWTLGSRYITLRQDPKRSPTKLGLAHREGWIGYLLDGFLFTKAFRRVEQAAYPDGGVNFETFTNEDILELESLGPLVRLAPGEASTHEERWTLHKDIPACETEADLDRHVRTLAQE